MTSCFMACEKLYGLFEKHTKLSRELEKLEKQSMHDRFNSIIQDSIRQNDLKQVLALYNSEHMPENTEAVEDYITKQLKNAVKQNDILKIKIINNKLRPNSKIYAQLRSAINEYLLDINKRINSACDFIKISFDMNMHLSINRLITFFNTNFRNASSAEKDRWLNESVSLILLLNTKKYMVLLNDIMLTYENMVLSYSELAFNPDICNLQDVCVTTTKLCNKSPKIYRSSVQYKNISLLKEIYKEKEITYFTERINGKYCSKQGKIRDLKYLLASITTRSQKLNVTIGNKIIHIIKNNNYEDKDELILLL